MTCHHDLPHVELGSDEDGISAASGPTRGSAQRPIATTFSFRAPQSRRMIYVRGGLGRPLGFFMSSFLLLFSRRYGSFKAVEAYQIVATRAF